MGSMGTLQPPGHQNITADMDPIHCWCYSVAQSCLTLCSAMDYSTLGFPVLYFFYFFPVLYFIPEFAQSHVHWANDVIQRSHPLSSPFPPALNLSQRLFQWIGSTYQVGKLLELQYQSFQWIFTVNFFRFDFLAVQGTLKSLLQH